jgi:PHS family inorganic phosphate transporter-like MFS transporter
MFRVRTFRVLSRNASDVFRFAPTRLRGRMLTAVFMCQPLGQLAATLVALIATTSQRKGIPPDAMPDSCNAQCLKTMDSIWRWIIGVGVIPAVLALWFRLTIIESPRYTADVGQDTQKAASELKRYLMLRAQSPVDVASSSSIDIVTSHPGAGLRQSGSGASSEIGLELHTDYNHRGRPAEEVPTFADGAHVQGTRPLSGAYSDDAQSQGSFALSDHEQYIERQGNEHLDPENAPTSDSPPVPSWNEFKQYFWHDGNLRTLIATSFCWMALDLPFYGLGMSSPHIISTLWYGKHIPKLPIYKLIVHDVWQSLVVVSLGAVVGCLITLCTIDRLGRRNIQMNGFFWLFILFVVIGGSFNHLYETGGSAAIIVLYILCQIFFNFGPNTTTYIMPAELFPTRYRGLCHGISAAFGKLGSVVAQLFLTYVDYGHGVNHNVIQKWLPYSLLIFSVFMLAGLIVTWQWIPGQERGPEGKNKTLEEWEVGRITPNGFAQTRLSRIVERIWKIVARIGDSIYLLLDRLAGGEVAEMREQAKREEQEMTDVPERSEEIVCPANGTEASKSMFKWRVKARREP